MKKIRAILVDDEESARDVLENLLLRFCPEIELLAKCTNVEEAVETIKQTSPDLVFLDIEMPNYAGFEIVRFFEKINFRIIFVTAYDQYALRAFEISAVDYLLKPIDIDRLKQSVQKAGQSIQLEQNSAQMHFLSEALETKEVKSILLTDKGYHYPVALSEIIAIEAQESYSTIYTTNKKYIASKNLKHFERILSESPDFMRVHKSWIIHQRKIVHYSRSELNIHLENGIIAKLSRYKKPEFEDALLG